MMLPSYPQHLKYVADEKLTNFYLHIYLPTYFPLPSKENSKNAVVDKNKIAFARIVTLHTSHKNIYCKENHYLKSDFDSKLDALT